MRLPTYNEFETKVRADLDLQDTDNFVGQDEMAGLTNEAIDAAEALIMATHEDYFLTSATLTLVSGESSIALPTDIYGQKVREVIYKNGDRIFPLTELRDPQMFYQKAVIDRQSVSLDEYSYFFKSATAGQQDTLMITPPALESGAYLEMWYIRNANRIPLQAAPDSSSRATQLATVIDIPEWRAYLEQYVKWRCYQKMKDQGAEASAAAALEKLGELMIINLKDKKLNNANDVPMDTSHYWEHN